MAQEQQEPTCNCTPPNILNDRGKRLTGEIHYGTCPIYIKGLFRNRDGSSYTIPGYPAKPL